MRQHTFRPFDSAHHPPTKRNSLSQCLPVENKCDQQIVWSIDIAHILFFIVCIVVGMSSLILFFDASRNHYTVNDATYASLPALCAKSSWIELDDRSFDNIERRRARLHYSGTTYFDRITNTEMASPRIISLAFFEGKDIEIEGGKDSSGLFYPLQVRCVGDDADPYLHELYDSIIVYIVQNIHMINQISDDIVIDNISFVKNDIVHVHTISSTSEDVYVLKIVYLMNGFDHEIVGTFHLDQGHDTEIFGQEQHQLYNRKVVYEFDALKQNWYRVW